MASLFALKGHSTAVPSQPHTSMNRCNHPAASAIAKAFFTEKRPRRKSSAINRYPAANAAAIMSDASRE